MPKKDKAEELDARGQAILAMLDEVPLELLKERTLQLLNATRHVSMGRDRDAIEEPDNAVRLKVWQTIIEQRAGAAGTRKPIVPEVPKGSEEAKAGVLKAAGN